MGTHDSEQAVQSGDLLTDLMHAYYNAREQETAIRRAVNDARRRLSAASRERYAIGRKLDEAHKANSAICVKQSNDEQKGE